MPFTAKRWPYLSATIIAACLGLQCLDYNANEQRVLADELPALAVSESKLDFGEIRPSDTPDKTIQLTNQSADPIAIESIVSTCACTLVESDVSTLAPGESADIKVSLTVSDYPSNKVNTRVHILPKGPDPELVVVKVNATITPEYVVTPQRVDFGEIKLASQPVQTITLKQSGDTPVEVLRVEAPDNIVASFHHVSPKPVTGTTQNAQPPPAEWLVEVKPLNNLPPGPLSGRVSIVTNVKRIAKVDIPINGRIMGLDCTITPKVIVFGPSKPGDTVSTVHIEGSKDLRLANVFCENTELEFTEPSQTEFGAIAFDVTLHPNATPGDKGGKLTLELTEGPAQQTFTVPYFGTVTSAS